MYISGRIGNLTSEIAVLIRRQTHKSMDINTTQTSTDRFAGPKYQRGRDTAEIAKLFRADVAAAMRAGELPKGLKLSVRISRYAGGSSINVAVKACPGTAIANPGHVLAAEAIPNVYVDDMRVRHMYTDAARAVMAKLETLLEAYNRSEIDSQTDYFNVKFYGHVTIASELLRADRAAVVDALRTGLVQDCKVEAMSGRQDSAIRICVAVAADAGCTGVRL